MPLFAIYEGVKPLGVNSIRGGSQGTRGPEGAGGGLNA
jgi:hypothetical protein